MPAEQTKTEPLHDHDLELANRGGILLRDSTTASEAEPDSPPHKRGERPRHAAKQV